MIGLMVVMLTFFSHAEYSFTYRVLMLSWGIGMEFKDKMILHCFREAKGKQVFTTRILYNILALNI